MKTLLKPVTATNHPDKPAIKALTTASAPKGIVLSRSYQYLVTHHGVPPERAKRLLGLT